MRRIRCGLFQTWAFSHAFLTEIQTELHTNKCAMRFELSSVKWLQFTPFVPAPVWKWRESRWQVNGRPRPVTGRAVSPPPDVQSRIVLAKEFVRSLPETVRIILQQHKQVWGAFQKSFTFSKSKCYFLPDKVRPFLSFVFFILHWIYLLSRFLSRLNIYLLI